MDFKAGIRKTKRGIEKMIKMLDADADFGSTKSKTILKSRRAAFITAAQMTVSLYEMEVEEVRSKIDSAWYKKTINKLIEKGESEIDTMFDGVAQDIIISKEGDYSEDINAKSAAFKDVQMMREEVKKLEQIIKENTNEDSFEIIKGSDGVCEGYAE